MNQTIKVIAAIIDVEKLTLYMPNGSALVIPQGDPRVKRIVDHLKVNTPTVENPLEVDISEQVVRTAFDEFSENSQKRISFFRVAKQFFKQLFEITESLPDDKFAPAEPIAPISLGDAAVLDEIMAHAKPTGTHVEDSTVVAVVDGVMIPGVENIVEQVKYANETEIKGMEAFFKRLATVATKRRHSAEDLMKFLKSGDLPIADDGSIIAYKILNTQGNDFVDCHSKKVTQRVGDFVHMDETLVDPCRTQDCSNGLHVARRDYLSSFSGNVCCLIKIAPEDVIAVPQYDGRKMRVCGYHIILQLSDAIRASLQNNHALTYHAEGASLIADAITGNHVGILRHVKIGGQMGTNLTITNNKTVSVPVKKVSETDLPKEAKVLEESNFTTVGMKADTVSPASVVGTGGSVRVQKAQGLLKQMQQAKTAEAKQQFASELKDFKKTSKVSWEKLGLSQTEVALVEKSLQT